METLFDALKGTPWWVYVLFVYPVYVGIQSRKRRMVSVNKIFIIPLIFVILSICGLIVDFEGMFDLFFWAVTAVAGFFIGDNLTGPIKKIRADRKKLLAYVPGSPIVLILVLSIFVLKFLIGYFETMNGVAMHIASVGVNGAIGGIFVGRTRAFLLQFSKTKHENLKKGGNPRKKSLL